MTRQALAGGCFCGDIRIRGVGSPDSVTYCHCRDCRRWSGAPVTVFAGYPDDKFEVTRGEPRVYESSPGIRRSFCGKCGTSLTYVDERLPGEVYVTVGAFDEPGLFEPEVHSWSSQRLGWFHLADGLPRHEESSRPR